MSSISPGPPRPTPSLALKNVTIDDTDSSLKYSQGWKRSVSSSAHGGSFQSSDNVGDVVSFSLPDNAVAVYYFGFKQSSGALYEACVDCHAKDSSKVDVIDGHSNDAHSDEPILLYEKTDLDPNISHSLALINVPDSRFANHSTITVDSFVVTVQSGHALYLSSASSTSTSSSSASTSVMTSMSAMSMIAMNPASTTGDDDSPPATQAPPQDTPTPTSTLATASASASDQARGQDQNALSSGERAAQRLRSPLVVTGIILAVLFVVCTALFALMYFMRRRKRQMTAPGKMYTEGHWAARFFGEKGRGSIWFGRDSDRSGGGAEQGERLKVAKGTMIERLVPDRPTYASLPSRPKPPPVSSLVYSDRPSVRNAPASYPFNMSQPQGPARTVPRSAFPSQTQSRPPGPPGPPGPPTPPGQFFVQNQQLVRAPSQNSMHHPSHLSQTYSRAPNPMVSPTSRIGPSPPPGPYPIRNPSLSTSTIVSNRPVMNPYVEEARARVRDRARGFTQGNDGGIGTGPGTWQGLRPELGQVNGYYGPVPSTAGAWYERPGPRPGYGPPEQYYGVQRNGSSGSQYIR